MTFSSIRRISFMRPSYLQGSRALIAASGVLALVGCAEGPLCPELGNCGGNIVGAWAQRPPGEAPDPGYCQEQVHRPPPEQYLQSQPVHTARTPPPERTNFDWCYDLLLTSDEANALKSNFYWWENLVYGHGRVTYEENGEYAIDFGRTGWVNRYYSRTCLTRYGHDDDCAGFQARLFEANEGAGEYSGFECSADTEKGGCNCRFQIGEADAAHGVYSVSGSTVTHFSSSPVTHFSQATFCQNGDTLQLSGMHNSYLWDRLGLRTIELVRVNCSDGIAGPGESGVDCGLACPAVCP